MLLLHYIFHCVFIFVSKSFKWQLKIWLWYYISSRNLDTMIATIKLGIWIENRVIEKIIYLKYDSLILAGFMHTISRHCFHFVFIFVNNVF